MSRVRAEHYSVTKHVVARVLPILDIDMVGGVIVHLPAGAVIESVASTDESGGAAREKAPRGPRPKPGARKEGAGCGGGGRAARRGARYTHTP
ncbi:MAG: hypothetical protein AAF226_12470, partial [Verrucomicrobiota bacterium]